MSISSYTTVTMIDSRPARITLAVPKSTDIINRIITFKDLYGSASNSTVTLVTRGGDTFEDGTFSTIMSNAYQTVNLYAGLPGKWLNVGATGGGGGDSAGLTTVSNHLNALSTNIITISTNLNTVSNTGATNATNITTVSNSTGTNTTNLNTVSNHLNSVSTNLITISTNLNTVSNTVAAGRFTGISTNTISTNLVRAGYISSPQGYISSLIVDSLSFSLSNSFIVMGDIITTSVSTIQTFTSSLTTNNLRVGTVSTLSYIAFPGLQQGYAQTVIAEQATASGIQELLLFKGSTNTDRIRMQTTGPIVFEPGVSARVFPATGSNVTPAMIITTGSNVGIGVAAPTVALDVAGVGRLTGISTNTISTNSLSVSNINGIGELPITAASGCNVNVTGTYINLVANNVQFSSNFAMNSGTTANVYNLTVQTGLNMYSNTINNVSNINFTTGGSISNANVTRTIALSTNIISTNIVNAGYLVGLLPGTTGLTSVSPLALTNGSAPAASAPQIEFQASATGGLKHFVGSRHRTNELDSASNSIDFWLYSASSGGTTASTAPGTSNVNTMSVTARGVGIYNNAPTVALDVVGAGRFTALSTNEISTGYIEAYNGYFSNIDSVGISAIQGNISTLYVDSISTTTISTNTIFADTISTNIISTGTLTVGGSALSARLQISTNNTTLTDPASIIIKTPNTSYFYEDYTNLTNYITISNYGAQNGDYINIVNTGNSGAPATFQVLDGSVGASTIIRYIYPGHAGVVAYSSSQWWPL